MNDQLLTTKLHLPILRKDIVARGRLVERLDTGLWQEDGFVRKLTLVSAPAGFGKTTLVSEWLSTKGRGVKTQVGRMPPLVSNAPVFQAAWLTLDDGDNDPVRFLAYFIAALRQIQPEFGSATRAVLQLPQPLPPSVIQTMVVNELSGIPVPFIMALDDYHVIHTPSIHYQIAFILDHQPANMHLVIITREDPLLPVARLRARGQLLEIRQGDLRFTQAETAQFMQSGKGLPLDLNDIAALERHTEGWAVGLELAALSMRGQADLAAFIRDFIASDRYILDYLVEEVLERQPAEVQDFLLQTSILGRMCGSLCDAVTGRAGGAEMLRSLEQANLFIVPLDPPRNWYRYHHLFAELLQHRLRLASIPKTSLHQRASQWHEAQGFLQEAVDHSILAQDWGNAARLIGTVNSDMFKRGEAVTLLGWCNKLPHEIVFSSIELCLVHAWAALITSQFDIAAQVLERAEQMAPPCSYLLGQVASAQAFLARSKRDDERAIAKSEQALALLPGTDVAIRGNIAMNLGIAYWQEGRMSEAESVLIQACDFCSKASNFFSLITAQIFLARIAAVRGELHRAAEMSEALIQAGGQVPILCLAHYDLAAIHLEWNDLPEANKHFDLGFELSQRSGNLEFLQSGHVLRGILAHARGDDTQALAALTEANTLGRDLPAVVRSRTAAFGVQLALSRSDAQMLTHWSAQVKGEVDAHSFYRFMGLTHARLLIARGNKAQAAEALKLVFKTASAAGWGYGALVVRILQSLASRTQDEAVQFISDALRMGQPEGFIRSFVDAGSAIIPLLQEAAQRGIAPVYVGQILSIFGEERRQEILGQRDLVEPLSNREIEVLRLVTAGLSNREIAARLFISPGTAKTHIHNLCGKMGVRNRTEAAMRAKELGLV